jgi:hypothetical protein
LSSHRKIALVTGVFFIITIIPAPIAAFILYAPVLNDPDYVVGAGADTIVKLGAFLEVIIAIAIIGRRHAVSDRQEAKRRLRPWLCRRSGP